MTHVAHTVTKDSWTGRRPFEQHTLTLTKATRLDDARALGANCQEDDVRFTVITEQDVG